MADHSDHVEQLVFLPAPTITPAALFVTRLLAAIRDARNIYEAIDAAGRDALADHAYQFVLRVKRDVAMLHRVAADSASKELVLHAYVLARRTLTVAIDGLKLVLDD